jgi:hypothetical protein
MKLLLVSVDWDFFFEDNPSLDMHRNDSWFHFVQAWAIREAAWKLAGKTVEELIPWKGPTLHEFHREIKERLPAAWGDSANAQSHVSILKWIDKLIARTGVKPDVINFDAHHDLCYTNPKNYWTQDGELIAQCGNWVYCALLAGKIGHYRVVYPDWRKRFPEGSYVRGTRNLLPADYRGRFHVSHWSDWLEEGPAVKADSVAFFFCRSGGWVPPCYDAKFNEMVEMFAPGSEPIPPRRLCNITELDRQIFAFQCKLQDVHSKSVDEG